MERRTYAKADFGRCVYELLRDGAIVLQLNLKQSGNVEVVYCFPVLGR